ncbi:amine oxidase [Aspergillus bertholletiae]|uniref:Amine oxidase n=1 Tax=Aspergillus bertholletiae TaxID=1226010 RepID=A0A5N7B0W1_9EURO|nr:amine oxidase [Aspergillus bertholletiae]
MTDVVVIGAGLSGLQAIRSLQDLGLTTVLLEARSRVGGKTWSIPAGSDGLGVADLGAEWLNDTTQPHVYRLAQDLGLEFAQVRVEGDAVLQLNGEGCDNAVIRHPYGEQAPLPDNENHIVERMKELFSSVYSTIDLTRCHECDYDDITLEDFVRTRGGGPATLATVAVWTRVMLGCEPGELSAASFFIYCQSQGGLMKMRSGQVQGRYVTVRTGTQSIAEGLATSLSPGTVRLDTAVQSIVQSPDGVVVYSTAGHVFRARKAIVAFSTPLYKKISFDPPLPPPAALLVSSTALGYYSKVMVSYSRPWWKDKGLSGASQSFVGPAAATRDTSDDRQSQFRVTSFIAGQPGREWSRLPAAARKTAVLQQLAHVFASNDAHRPIDYMEQQWSSEEWSLGCPCPYTPPGVLANVGEWLAKPHGHIHFVGTETAIEWKGYMEGALTAGVRGATEVAKLLSTTDK